MDRLTKNHRNDYQAEMTDIPAKPDRGEMMKMSAYLPKKLVKQIDALAKAKNYSRNELFAAIVEAFFEERSKSAPATASGDAAHH